MLKKLTAAPRAVAACAFGLVMAASSPVMAQTLAIGANQQISGTLTESDQHLSDESYADTYAFAGRAGQHVRIDMVSSAFDTYLTIQGPGGYSQANDDVVSGNLNSELDIVLPADGTYTIVANSLAARTTGDYTLAVSDLGMQSASNASGAYSAYESAGAAALNVDGDLAQGDSQLNGGEFADTYTIHGRAGERIDAVMQSSDFDTYIIVRGNGVQQDNDDAGDLQHSRLVLTLPQDGDYTVTATSYAPGATGHYQLTVQDAAPGVPDTNQAQAQQPQTQQQTADNSSDCRAWVDCAETQQQQQADAEEQERQANRQANNSAWGRLIAGGLAAALGADTNTVAQVMAGQTPAYTPPAQQQAPQQTYTPPPPQQQAANGSSYTIVNGQCIGTGCPQQAASESNSSGGRQTYINPTTGQPCVTLVGQVHDEYGFYRLRLQNTCERPPIIVIDARIVPLGGGTPRVAVRSPGAIDPPRGGIPGQGEIVCSDHDGDACAGFSEWWTH